MQLVGKYLIITWTWTYFIYRIYCIGSIGSYKLKDTHMRVLIFTYLSG